MGLSTTDNWQRYGRQVDADMATIDQTVDRLGATLLGGPWWQGWKGFYGGWTQYYQEEVAPNPISPFHDDSQITEFANKLDGWKTELKGKQDALVKAGQISSASGAPQTLLSTTSTQAQSDTGAIGPSSGASWLLPAGLGLVALFGLAYLVSSGAKLRAVL